MKYFLSYIKKVSDGNWLFWLSVFPWHEHATWHTKVNLHADSEFWEGYMTIKLREINPDFMKKKIPFQR